MSPHNYRRIAVASLLFFCLSVSAVIQSANADVIQCFSLDTNPGWTTQGQWAFGVPTGGGSYCHDPTSGYTGSNVYGYNLNGDYPNSMPAYYLTTTAINCTNFENVTLNFWRWLGIESSSFDHATVEVSNNGSTWTTVWNHSGGSFCDGSWVVCTYDISAVADNQPTVYIRWSMGPTDSSVTYPGWNIDDICITGTPVDRLSVTPPEGLDSNGYEGGPFTPAGKDYTLSNIGVAALNWTAQKTATWLNITPTSGTLQPGQSTIVSVTINETANGLAAGQYSDTATFTNTTSGFVQNRAMMLTINALGEIEVTDSIPPPDDLNMPFGETSVGAYREETLTITNTDPVHSLLVTDISLSGFGLDYGKRKLQSSFTASPKKVSADVLTNQSSQKQNATAAGTRKPFAVEWSSDRTTKLSEAILVYADDWFHTAPNTYVDQALQYLGLNYTAHYNGDFAGFQTALTSGGPWDLVIFENDNYSPTSSVLDALLAYVNGGGRIIAHSWHVANGHPLWAAMGVAFVTDDSEPPDPVYWWDDTHHIFNVPEQVPEFTALTGSRYGIYGQQVEPVSGAVAIAGYTTGPATNKAALIIGPQGRTIFRGFLDGQNDADLDSDGKPDGMELWVNMIGFSPVSAFRLENAPTRPVFILPLGSIDVNVIFEPIEVKEYQCDISITSSDPDESVVTVHLSGTGIPNHLDIAPTGQRSFSGHPGGPFVPSKITYTLHNNNASQTISWSVSKTAGWLDISPLAGSIAPGASVNVTAKTNSIARTLPQGDYNDVLLFTNLTTTDRYRRNILLHVFTAPKIWIDPPEGGFGVNVRQGETLIETLTIGNSGDASLSFELSSLELPAELLSALSPVTELAADEDEMVLEYSFSAPILEKTENFDLLKIEGLELSGKIGAPIVPVRPVEILLPYGKQVVDCSVTAQDLQQLPGAFILQPAQKPYPLNFKGPIERTPPNAKIYQSSSLWPGKYSEKIGIQSKRGYQVFLLNLFPLQYTPSAGSVSYASRLLLTITLADADSPARVMPSKPATAKLATSVDNPGALETYSDEPDLPQLTTPSLTLPPGGPYQYVVITNQALKDAAGPWNFQALCDTRTAAGIPATIVTTEWIYANYDGTKPNGGSDNQTRIRNFLIDAYQNWGTQYVLLGGINALVPARLFYVDSFAGEVDYMPVDMYYGCVDPPTCTFDYDADNLYGEPTDGVGGGEVDLFAEIYVGRAAVENATELASFVRKTLAYNTTRDEYLHRIAMIGEYLGFGGVSDYATDSMEQIRTGGFFDGYFTYGFEDPNQTNLIDFNTIGCLPDDPTCCWPLYDASAYSWLPDRLTCLMNGGIHVFNHLGHANETYCMKLTTSGLPLLTNDDYFFVYSQGCYPGAFDTTNCFAEVLTTIEHGAFGAVMNARYGWGTGYSTDGPGQRFARQFWDAPLGECIFEIGRANQDSKEDNIWDLGGACIRWSLYELNLFGDPAQKFRFTEGVDWLTIFPQTGIVAPGTTKDVNVVFEPGTLPLGTYYAEIFVMSNDHYNPYINVPVTMTVEPFAFSVTPEDGMVSTGVMGGPFKPRYKTYTVHNAGDMPRDWQADADVPWLTMEPGGGTLGPGESLDVNVFFNPDAFVLEPNEYTALVTFTDLTIGLECSRSVNLKVTIPDFFTELFNNQDNDLDNLTLTLSPDNSGHFYMACIEKADEFPTNPAGGNVVPLMDDDYAVILVADGKLLPFYGQYYDVFYIGSNGYVTFDTGDVIPLENMENHFLYKRISALFDDLNPAAGGTVSLKQSNDAVVVTCQDVPEYSLHNHNSFQIEMFFDGTIRITWLGIAAKDGLVGLSPGNGLADYFIESDISRYPSCLGGDYDYDGDVDWLDLGFFAGYWLSGDCSMMDGFCDGCDRSRDGIVNFDDFSFLGVGWYSMQ